MENVICTTCQKSYTDVFDKTQAFGCASEYIAKQKAIFCHYGSRHDTSKFNVIEGNFKEGIICDECIDTALENQTITLDETFDYWKPLRQEQSHEKITLLKLEDFLNCTKIE